MIAQKAEIYYGNFLGAHKIAKTLVKFFNQKKFRKILKMSRFMDVLAYTKWPNYFFPKIFRTPRLIMGMNYTQNGRDTCKNIQKISKSQSPLGWWHGSGVGVGTIIIMLYLLTVPCKKSGDLVNLPYRMGIFNEGLWALKVPPPPWTPESKQCKIGGFQKGTSCPCDTRGCKVAGWQTFGIWKKSKVFIDGAVFIWHYEI